MEGSLMLTLEPPRIEQSPTVPVHEVERELSRLLHALQGPGGGPMVRAHLSNLIVFCNRIELTEKLEAEISLILPNHPARVLLLVGVPGSGKESMTATALVRSHRMADGRRISSEQITLRAQGAEMDRFPFAVRSLLIGDLPINLWWAVPEPPPMGGSLLYDLGECAQQIIYDSIGWVEPARGVVATASWLTQADRHSHCERWRVVSDLNWRRLKYWRRLMAQALDPGSAPGALESVSEVLVEHGPHAVIQAWELVSWLASRLGWRVQTGRIQPGVEISWQFAGAKRPVRVRIRRLDHGPSNIRHVRVACEVEGKLGAMNFNVEQEYRLSVSLEGVNAAPRTLTVSESGLGDLVARQLSDRERDPVFHESMPVARALAQSVLG
jgi:glucose-6-phosphate dehydrogenase assembly protein OpcA